MVGYYCPSRVCSFVALLVSLQYSLDQSEAARTSKVVTSVLSLLWAGGLFKLWLDFSRFGNLAKRLTDKCADYLIEPNISERDAVKLWHEYQLGRASASLIPDWYYNWRQEPLNELWAKVKAKSDFVPENIKKDIANT